MIYLPVSPHQQYTPSNITLLCCAKMNILVLLCLCRPLQRSSFSPFRFQTKQILGQGVRPTQKPVMHICQAAPIHPTCVFMHNTVTGEPLPPAVVLPWRRRRRRAGRSWPEPSQRTSHSIECAYPTQKQRWRGTKPRRQTTAKNPRRWRVQQELPRWSNRNWPQTETPGRVGRLFGWTLPLATYVSGHSVENKHRWGRGCWFALVRGGSARSR